MKFNDQPFMPTTPRRRVTRPNEAWAIDFMVLDFAQRPFVILVADVGTRRPLSATVSHVVVEDIVARLERLVQRSGSPKQVWLDYSIAYNSHPGRFHQALQDWAEQHRISLTHDPMFRTRSVAEQLLRDLRAFLRNKHFPTLIELGHDIERWRQSAAAAAPIPNVNQ
jgi:ribosomal protein S18 acetylase RimI-like enzyme